ncbi:MAG TPA: ribonuclease J [Candidatus Saccharimonas sp.]|nr:ribonuclease J [Candidatus Saccharimonas sp.]
MPQHTDLMPALDTVPVNKSIYNGLGGQQQTKRAGKPAPDANAAKGQGLDQAAAAGGERRANYTAREPKVKVVLLGGVAEIGKSMMAIEYENDIVIIDMGFAFPDPVTHPGIDYMIPDTTYLEKNRYKVRGIIITHGHMDHIGGSGYIIPKFPVPVYGSRLSLAFVEKQIGEFKINKPQWIVMDPDKHERVQIGAFNVELVRVTHTISDSTAVVLRTPAGTIINTGDWRADPEPLDGKQMDFKRLEEIGKEGVDLLMSDSTSCDRPGHGSSERVVAPTIADLFARAQGRIIISSFSSSITRVQLIIDAAQAAGRKLALVGRSTLTNVELCVKLGYLKVPAGLVVRVQDIVNLPDDKVVILCTGSQGEENSALVRMSTGDHQNVKIKPGDTVILSSSVIPGNEVSVVQLIDDLMREGATVFSRATEGLKNHGPVHVGGHGFREDVGDLVALIKPKYYLPIHGEFHHMIYSAEVAVERGVPKENIFVMDNGDVLELTPSKAVRGARVPAGAVLIDGAGVGDVEGVVLRDRVAMGDDGMFMIVATVSRKTGKLLSSPDIISRGFIYMKENEELINKARMEVRRLFETRTNTGGSMSREDWAKFKLRVRDEIGDMLYAKTKRNPMVLPVINEI